MEEDVLPFWENLLRSRSEHPQENMFILLRIMFRYLCWRSGLGTDIKKFLMILSILGPD